MPKLLINTKPTRLEIDTDYPLCGTCNPAVVRIDITSNHADDKGHTHGHCIFLTKEEAGAVSEILQKLP
jgi:hypothetical protein